MQTPNGERPWTSPIHVAHVELAVVDLSRVASWYQTALGLQVIEATSERIALGVTEEGGEAIRLVSLASATLAERPGPTDCGLFHIALVLPTRADLAHWLTHAAANGVTLSGASDHLVTEALYLDDPEGNGIELYFDRPRQDWPRSESGAIRMATERLDLRDLASAAPKQTFTRLAGGTRVGHLHLSVDETAEAVRFFQAGLGFERMVDYPGAVFLGSGGYHHHIGANVWRSERGAKRDPRRRGLSSYTIRYDDRVAVMKAAKRLAEAEFCIDINDERSCGTDPWGIGFELIVRSL
ncbi:MAG: VOC family protein [Fulvimarina manganoxydans]|uniref:VOC family protein n=1 Tax=Fulvimarina manganoxydans TaxID=937218 RepID=UPI00235724AE|nr:VOC family protein [Fulvimarina manganoxydans]MCK5930647.1 VOC family protein [Fulvimarina manganoxydans]